MTQKLTVPLYTLTLILSAFLLFSIQPLFAKMILPLLGGTPSVWNTAMVFFQAMLLAGYAYAHGTSRFLTIRKQAVLHITLLLGFAFFLPILLPPGLNPAAHSAPALWQLSVMAMVVGAPFFIIAASAPMFQRWFSASTDKDAANPYFLYAASNIGSMAALLSYPLVIEPFMPIKAQSFAWAGGYGVLIALSVLCAWAIWKNGTGKSEKHQSVTPLKHTTKLSWIILAFIPSSLLLGVTTYVTTDIASVPLLWIAPLVLYLLTFIIAFSRRPLLNLRTSTTCYSAIMIALIFTTASTAYTGKMTLFVLHFILFFFSALMCHQLLADKRPQVAHLTAFYLYMSLGGVLGGLFNALLAPLLFKTPVEYTLILCSTLFIRCWVLKDQYPLWTSWNPARWIKTIDFWFILATFTMIAMSWENQGFFYYYGIAILSGLTLAALYTQPFAFAIFGSIILFLYSSLFSTMQFTQLHMERNFFGVLRVHDTSDGMRSFLHGTTLHGAQPIEKDSRLYQLTYYNPMGPLGDAFRLIDNNAPEQRIGGIGLGVGTIACYTQPGRSFDFYEIDPAVARIAQDRNFFTYLSDCGSPYDIIIGDGRLSIDDVPDGTYDLLLIDAFSSDNIPMHLLTLEAFQAYMQKVKANGIIVFNISNRFINLEPQMAALSAATNVPALIRYTHGGQVALDTNLRYAASSYVLFTPDPEKLIRLRMNDDWKVAKARAGFRLWTDDYANIIAGLRILNP